MDNWDYIVTHPGKAHRDEFYAVGLAAAINHKGLKVVRRQPTPAELENPRILVLDTGGRFEPEKGNFDHHQLPNSELGGKPFCALSLFAASMPCGDGGTYDDLWRNAPWYRAVILQDTLGPSGLARQFGLEEMPEEFSSGIETWVLAEFGCGDTVDPLWVEMACDCVLAKRDAAISFREAQKNIAVNSKWIATEFGDVLWGPTLEPFGLSDFIKKSGRMVVASVTREPRDGRLCLFRYSEALDFNRLRGRPDTGFVHSKGFMANGGWKEEDIPAVIAVAARRKE